MKEQIKIAYQAQNEMHDQSAKADAGKPRIDLVPTEIVRAIARVREYGCNKYPGDKNNWKSVEMERYVAALGRHYLAFIDNPKGVDAESGLPHLWHIACNVAFLCEFDKFDRMRGDCQWK